MKRTSVALALMLLLFAACDSGGDSETPSEVAEPVESPEPDESETDDDGQAEENGEDGGGENDGSSLPDDASTVDKILQADVDDHGIITIWDESPKEPLEFEVDDFYFEPTVVFGQFQRGLLLEVHNEGAQKHSLTIPNLKINEVIEPGATQTIGISFPASGQRHDFFCRFHEGQGMQGVLLAVQDRKAYFKEYKGKGKTSGGEDQGSGSSEDY